LNADFDALYRQHYARVFALCRRLVGSEAQAQEAAQEVFVRAYRALDRYDRAQPFAAWVLRIASNHCIDLLRRRGHEPIAAEAAGIDLEAAATTAEDDDAGGLAPLVAAERARSVRDAIDALPDNYRLPVVLAYFEEASYDEIAARLGITRNHVGVLLLRARRALRQALAAEFAEQET
jgi:RNA polymerase sigma-70 factor (ECF subfamily)